MAEVNVKDTIIKLLKYGLDKADLPKQRIIFDLPDDLDINSKKSDWDLLIEIVQLMKDKVKIFMTCTTDQFKRISKYNVFRFYHLDYTVTKEEMVQIIKAKLREQRNKSDAPLPFTDDLMNLIAENSETPRKSIHMANKILLEMLSEGVTEPQNAEYGKTVLGMITHPNTPQKPNLIEATKITCAKLSSERKN